MQKSQENLYQSPFLNKITGLNLQLILKKTLEYFPVNFEKFLRTPFKNSFYRRDIKILGWCLGEIPQGEKVPL